MIALPPPDSFACFMERVRCLQVLYEASVTSGGRSSLRNSKVGGNRLSKHKIEFGCMAVDLVPNDMWPEVRKEMVITANKFGMWAEDEEDHVHVQGLLPGEARLP